MYAVVSSGGKQYRVEPGSTLTMERLAADDGTSITFDRVLLVGDGEDVTVGTPTVSGATVSATVLGEVLGPKIIIFKFKQKVKYRRRTGHRQHLVSVRIDGITANGRTTSAPETDAPANRARVRPAKASAATKPTSKKSAARKPAPKGVAAKSSSPKAATIARTAKKAAGGDTEAPKAKPAGRRPRTAATKREPKE